MKATKIAMAVLISALAASPLFAQSNIENRHNHARPHAQASAMYNSQKVFEAALKSIPASKIDVQPATPALSFNSNSGNAVYVLASFPASRTVVVGPKSDSIAAHVVKTSYVHGDF